MKVFVAGGTGRVGRELTRQLVEAGHDVVAASRHAETLEASGHVTPMPFDFHDGVDTIAGKLDGVDAIVFTAGSRSRDLLQTDAFGPVKLATAAAKAGVRRYVQLSSIYALEPERWAGEPSLRSITDYNIAKYFADRWLLDHSGLDLTIVQPSVLKEEPGTGRIELDPEHDGANPIPDVARVLMEVIGRRNTYGKVIRLRGGDEPIGEALARV